MSGRREAYPRSIVCSVGNRSVGPALDSTSAHLQQISVSLRAVGPSFGNGADWAYLCFCFGQRRESIEDKISDPSELLSVRTCFLCWTSWLRLSAWASENSEHCSVLCCCVEAARREAVQFGGCHYFDRISLFVYQRIL